VPAQHDRIRLSPAVLVTALGDNWPPDLVQAAIDVLAGSEGRFPSGARRLPPDLVRAVQRERLLMATLGAGAELGYRGMNVQNVIDRAGVSRPTFYEHFANKDDCFLAAFDAGAARLRTRVEQESALGGDVWRERLRRGLAAVLDFTRAEPDTARTVIVEARAADTATVMRRVALLDSFTACIDAQAHELLVDGEDHSALTAAGVVGGVESLLYSHIVRGDADHLDALLPSLMYFAVLPYEGHEAAHEALAASA
jgi:AcrR family transcriptional regulator